MKVTVSLFSQELIYRSEKYGTKIITGQILELYPTEKINNIPLVKHPPKEKRYLKTRPIFPKVKLHKQASQHGAVS